MPGGRRQVILLLQLANEASGLIFIPTLSCWQKGGAFLEEMRTLNTFFMHVLNNWVFLYLAFLLLR